MRTTAQQGGSARYHAGWLFSVILLLVTLGTTAVFVYSTVSHTETKGFAASWAPLMPATFTLGLALGFIRTGVIGPQFNGRELRIPRATRPQTVISVNDIAGVYLGRVIVNAYGYRGWVPIIWTREQSFVYIRALTSLRDTRDPGLLVKSHVGATVVDLYERVLKVQGPAGLVATKNPPITYGTGITALINPRDAEPVKAALERDAVQHDVHVYRPHDRVAALRGCLSIVAGAALLVTLISTLLGSSNSLVFGLSFAGCLLMGTIAWQSIRTFLHRSTMSAHGLHIRSALREALVHTEDIAGVGLVGIPWRWPSSVCRWFPVVWTTTTIQSIPNIVIYRRRDTDSVRLLSSRSGEVAADILNRVLVSQGPNGLIHQNLDPPPHQDYRVVRLHPDAAGDRQSASR